jgi:hypothetical protein
MHRQRTITVNQPAAGADWLYVFSNQAPVKLLSITALFVTAVTVANRAVALQAVDVDGRLLTVDPALVQEPASGSVTYSWRPGNSQYGENTADSIYSASCPAFWLPIGAAVKTVTSGIQAGDQWSSIFATYLVAESYHWLQLEELAQTVIGAG